MERSRRRLARPTVRRKMSGKPPLSTGAILFVKHARPAFHLRRGRAFFDCDRSGAEPRFAAGTLRRTCLPMFRIDRLKMQGDRRRAGQEPNGPAVVFADFDLAVPLGDAMNEAAMAADLPFIIQVEPPVIAQAQEGRAGFDGPGCGSPGAEERAGVSLKHQIEVRLGYAIVAENDVAERGHTEGLSLLGIGQRVTADRATWQRRR